MEIKSSKKTLKTIKVKYNQISDLNLNYIEKIILFQMMINFFAYEYLFISIKNIWKKILFLTEKQRLCKWDKNKKKNYEV